MMSIQKCLSSLSPILPHEDVIFREQTDLDRQRLREMQWLQAVRDSVRYFIAVRDEVVILPSIAGG